MLSVAAPVSGGVRTAWPDVDNFGPNDSMVMVQPTPRNQQTSIPHPRRRQININICDGADKVRRDLSHKALQIGRCEVYELR